MRCPRCSGTGKVTKSSDSLCRGTSFYDVDCEICDGTGAAIEVSSTWVPAQSSTCYSCKGTGKVNEDYVSGKYPSGKPIYATRKVTCSTCKGSGKLHAKGYYVKRYRPDYKARQGGCFITTACVYSVGESDEIATLGLLREFRDGFLQNLPDGPSLIEQYYFDAPRVVSAIDMRSHRALIYRDIYHRMVRPAVEALHDSRPEDALRIYSAMFNQLREHFLYLPSWNDGGGI